MVIEDCRGSTALIVGMTDCKEKISAAAGRISTQEGNAFEILDNSSDLKKNANLISKVTRSNHTSIIEHTVFNIAFKNVSVFVEQFLIEFRLASFTVKSRRYVNFSSSGFYTPDFENEDVEAKYRNLMQECFSEYKYFIEKGIPKEDARFLLPYCLNSNFYCTVNARELLNILRSMLFGRGSAFPELKNLGKQIFSQIENLTPGICSDFFARRPKKSDKLNLGFAYKEYEGQVEEKNKTQLLSYTPDAEKCVCRCALISSAQLSISSIEEIIRDNVNIENIISKVLSCSRPRALEAVSFTFRINNVSLSTITHFARHRMQSLEVPSLMLTNRRKHITPNSISKDKELLDRYSACFTKMANFYDEMKSKDIADELLVYCQLSGNTLDIVSTMNARELLLFFKLRCCSRAQWEIQEYAFEMLATLRTIAPLIFNKFGPSCYFDCCTEGPLTCGKSEEVKRRLKPKE